MGIIFIHCGTYWKMHQSQYLDRHQTMNMSNILRIVSFAFIVAFLAHESKAALLFLHVNPPKQQNVSFQKYKINFLTICYYFREHLSKSRILYINLIWTWNLAKKVWFLGKIFVFLFGFVDVRISIHFTKHVDWGILNCSTYLLLKNKK